LRIVDESEGEALGVTLLGGGGAVSEEVVSVVDAEEEQETGLEEPTLSDFDDASCCCTTNAYLVAHTQTQARPAISTCENAHNAHARTRPGDERRGKSLLLVAQGRICRLHQ
jgi:hypothetical protein